MITIYDKTGTAKLSAPIADKCIHHRGIMEEEYVSVIFNYDEAIQLKNGDYINTEYGRFEIVKLTLPGDKTASDGGYSYEQRFNPRWWRASQRKLFYNRQAGYEASWKMTHYASYFMDIVVDNMSRAGIGEFTYEIDADITGMQFVQFDGVSIIDGLTLIAEAWDAEWWFTDNVVHLGRCQHGSPVMLSMGTELANIECEESADTEFATRLFVFGSTRNIPKNYRKDLVFTVNATQSNGNVISDTTRPLLSEWFPKTLQAEVSYDTRKFDLPAKSINEKYFYVSSEIGNCAVGYSPFYVGQLAPRKYVLDLDNIKISCKWKKVFSGGLAKLYIKATIKGSGDTVLSYTQPVKSEIFDIPTENTEFTFSGISLPFTITGFISATISLEVFVVSTNSDQYGIACSCTAGSVSLSSKDKVYHVSGLTIETIEEDPRKIEGVIFNPYYATNDSESNWLKLPGGVTLAKGTKYRISPIHLSKVNSSYFVPVVGDDEVINELTDNRLAIPIDCAPPYIDAWENLAEEDVVEAIVTTETIFPRRTGTIDSITTKEYTETTENEDGTTTEKKWNAYRFTDSGITFSESYIIEEELRIIFQSGKLVGKDFRVNFNPDAEPDEESEKAQVWEIVRNEDYGTALPTDDFGPAVGDTYILYGYDTSFVADNLVEGAEQELLEFGIEQAKKLSSDKSNYRCETNAVRCAGYQADANGVMQYNEGDVIDLDMGATVELMHPVYFPDGAHTSRIRSFDRSLVNRYEVTYLVGEAKNYSRTGELADKIDAIEYQSKQKESAVTSSGTNVYIIKRNDVTVPSDHNVFSALRSRLEFMCRSVAEYVRTCWTFAKGIYVGSYVAGESGARIDENGNAEVGNMDVRGDVAVSDTATATDVVANKSVVSPRFTTPNFMPGGLTGIGAGMYLDPDTGLTHAECDYIVARRGMVLSVLTIEEINSVAGGIVASKAHGEVEEISAYTADDGSTRYVIILKDVNMFQLGDLVRFARWDYTNNSYRWAWIPVRGCNTETRVINIWASDLTDGMSLPEVGDKLVLMGNNSDKARQGFVYIIDNGIQCFDGVNTTSLDGKCRGVFGDLSNITDNGKNLSGYGVWTDNLFLGSQAEETFTEIVNGVVGNLSVGGRNLLLGTNKGTEGWMAHTDSVNPPSIYFGSDGSVMFDYVEGNSSASWELFSFELLPERIIEGHTYVVSLEVLESVTSTGMHLYLEIANNNGSGKLVTNIPSERPIVSEEWIKLTFTFTATASGQKGGGQRLRFVVPQSMLGKLSVISFRNLKLEEGNVATAYAPAPEDYYNNLNAFINGDYKAQLTNIQTQIDGKAETWCQSLNPADEWTTDSEKAKHKGDLWYDTSSQKTFYWDGSCWVQQNVPTEVFDKIDGKAQIFVKQPTPPYHVGDLWVQGNGGEILKCNTAREDGYYNAVDWGKASKYTDDSALNSFKSEYVQYQQTVSNKFDVTNQRFESLQGETRALVRNMLQKTNQGVANWWQSSIFKIYGTQGYGDIHYVTFERVITSSEAHYELFCFDLCPELIKSGKQYLLSFEILQHDGYNGNFTQMGGVNIFAGLAAPNWTDILATTVNERNGATTQLGAWVRMEYVLNATANGQRDGNTSVYLSLNRAQYNRLALFSIKNIQLTERTKKSTETITDDEFVEWRPAVEDSALDYADVVAEQAKHTAISQTKNDINIGAYAKTSYVDDKASELNSQINVQAGRITSEVTARETGDANLSTKIEQTASSISLKVAEKISELGITSLNYAYGTGQPVVLKTLNNIANQTNTLYDVTGLSANDVISLSCIIRIKDVVFDTQNDTVDAKLTFQLDNNFNYRGLGIYIRQSTFDGIVADEQGYKTLRVTATGITIPDNGYTYVDGERVNHTITPDIVGKVYMRLDYIDSKVDADGNDTGIIEISELKIEKGEECTAWTSRTQDMYEALLDTGIDIENRKIVATADSFVIQNNLGQVTASVDENGNLATGTVLCWNPDPNTKEATPYLTTLNRNGNGYMEWYYPLPTRNVNDNVSIQFGWEDCIDETTGEDTSSVLRFYKKDGSLAWKGGDFTDFLKNMANEKVITITPKSFHYIGDMSLDDAKAKVQHSLSLSTNATLYLKTVQENGKIIESYYCSDSSGKNKANGGAYTLPGTPLLGLAIEGSSSTSYRRTLYSPTNGIMQVSFVEWTIATSNRNDYIIDSPALPNQ